MKKSYNFSPVQVQIVIESGASADFGSLMAATLNEIGGRSVVLVSDKTVAALYEDGVLHSLRSAGFPTVPFTLRPGETSKSLATAADLYDFLAARGMTRQDLIVALGGGVVSDLAGFVAATWMRGVEWAIAPTTLESMIDAAIGGKTGVNLPAGKNLVGAFHQPRLVVIDPAFLTTVDARDVRAGLAESVKHALIDSEPFFAWHENNAAAALALDEAVLTELILRNVQIKGGIVEQDVREQSGRRMLLNLGHTIGHAIEACGDFALRHGECVALGLVAACRLSERMAELDPAVTARVIHLLSRFGLPTRLDNPIDPNRIMEAVHVDKKRAGAGAQRFVLLRGIGLPVIQQNIPDSQIRAAYASLLT